MRETLSAAEPGSSPVSLRDSIATLPRTNLSFHSRMGRVNSRSTVGELYRFVIGRKHWKHAVCLAVAAESKMSFYLYETNEGAVFYNIVI